MFQTKVAVFEKAVILDHPIFLSVKAPKLRPGQLHFLKWNHVFVFDDIITDFKTNNGLVHCRVAFTCSCEHARARLPLIEAVRFAESLRKQAQSSDLQKNMDQ